MKIIDKYFLVISPIPEQQRSLFDVARLASFFLACIQLLAIFYVVEVYQFERSSGIVDYAPYVVVAFVIYSFVSVQFRPALLFVFCLSIIYSAFGLVAGTFIIASGLSLIGICHLPVRFSFRRFMTWRLCSST